MLNNRACLRILMKLLSEPRADELKPHSRLFVISSRITDLLLPFILKFEKN